ncbi:MAG: hypothetical protein QM714_12065 [Nocardioides sp.]|uniref:hypothetical protein n=1 Tax=Nocardioides sp. TaxID=35761 RepID=UPI0039E3D736
MIPPSPGPSAPTLPIAVHGGPTGLAATYARVRALATSYDSVGDRLRHRAGLGARALADADLLESAVLAPLTFGRAEVAVALATTGPDGVLTDSVGWEADALLIRAAVRGLEEADQLVRSSLESLDYALGRAAGFTLGTLVIEGAVTVPVWLPPALLTVAGLVGVYLLLPPSLQQRVRDEGGELTEDLRDDIAHWIAEHPDEVQHLANGAGGLVDGFVDGLTPGIPSGSWPMSPTTEDAAGLLATFFPDDGSPDVSVRPDLGRPSPAPSSLAEVISHLDEVNTWSDDHHLGNNGTIEIQSWVDLSGITHHVVYLPGTDDLATLPGHRGSDVRDLPADLVLLSGGQTTYGDGIVQAMHDAGIDRDDPVLVVGHSEGGMEGVWLAHHAHDFSITQVVTVGSPVATMDPGPTPVLSLENHGDLVPLLDGEPNPDTPTRVTVEFTDPDPAGAAGTHDLHHYVRGAAAVDASTDPALTDQLDSLRAAGFLAGGAAETRSQVFQITRSP